MRPALVLVAVLAIAAMAVVALSAGRPGPTAVGDRGSGAAEATPASDPTANSDTPGAPPGQADVSVARAAPDPTSVPDPASAATAGPEDPSSGPWVLPRGADCLDLDRSGGRLHVCWEVDRYGAEEDAYTDTYGLRVGAIFSGGVEAARAILTADLVGEPEDRIFDAWPQGGYFGPCELLPVRLARTNVGGDVLCGRTVGLTDSGRWAHSVTWTCSPCRSQELPRALSAWVWVAVAAGTTPAWELYADLTPATP